MSYVAPLDIVASLINSGAQKATLELRHLLIRGILSGAILGYATVVAIVATLQTNVPLVGALVFPAGLVMIVLLGLELLTGSFAVVPMAVMARRASGRDMMRHFAGVMLGNLIGALLFAALMILTLQGPTGVALTNKIVAIAQAKTTAYEAMGTLGMASVFIKAVLCNWMVTLGVVLGMSSTSTTGKILAAWLPIFVFFTLGYEHAIVNFFVIPAGMMLGAHVSMMEWMVWNAIPVILGNFVGGFLFTGVALYLTFRPAQPVASAAIPATQPRTTPTTAATALSPMTPGSERLGVTV